MTADRPAFPSWIVLGGAILALGYLPTLTAPFDFIDDGNLVYPAPPGTTVAGHAGRWWDKVRANVEHLGPFRPVVWLHWEVAANTLGADPFLWRAARLGWCGLAAMALLWLLRELNVAPTAALVAAAAAMWNPYRNEIWTSLTLAEGVAMPYALLALVAARRRWDGVAVAALLAALGCKNTFVALVPAMMALRLWPDGVTWRDGLANKWRAALYVLPLALPAAHFVYFRSQWHAGQYETPGPSWEQAGRFAAWLKGAAGLDFLAVGLALVLVVLWRTGASPRTTVRGLARQYRAAVLAGALLLGGGSLVYLPLAIVAPRYTMPAVWGFDLLFAVLLTALVSLPLSWPKRVAWAGVAVGLVVMTVANVSRQEKLAARSRVLWDALHHLERTAPAGARVAWMAGDDLNAEEGIHFHWHLLHRGRGDVRVGLFDADGRPIDRVELPPLAGEAQYRVAADAVGGRWRPEHSSVAGYRMGRRSFRVEVEEARPPAATFLDPWVAAAMRANLDGSEAEAWRKLTESQQGTRPTAELKR